MITWLKHIYLQKMEQSAPRCGFSVVLAVLQERVFILTVDPDENMKALLSKHKKIESQLFALRTLGGHFYKNWPSRRQRLALALHRVWGFVVVVYFRAKLDEDLDAV